MNIYNIVNDYDPNDSFEIEAENENDAAFEALATLGWNVCKVVAPQEKDPDQYEFNF